MLQLTNQNQESALQLTNQNKCYKQPIRIQYSREPCNSSIKTKNKSDHSVLHLTNQNQESMLQSTNQNRAFKKDV